MLWEENRDKKPKVAFLCPYGYDSAPGQRFRVELFYDYISPYLEFKTFYFLDNRTTAILYKKGRWLRKFFGVVKGFSNRLRILFTLKSFDYVFIFRESTPLGPPIVEFILAKILGKKIIYDFDDAIWMKNTSNENWVAAKLKWHSKVSSICRWSYKVSCGNQFLSDFAKRYNKSVFTVPTIVDTERRHIMNKSKDSKNRITIGWTGSHSTLPLLEPIIPILKELEKKFDFDFLVIANKNPNFKLENFRFLKWQQLSEIEDLAQIDIGIMPLPDNEWCKGKCGFKAIQYMAMGSPALASPIGVNTKIVDHSINGFLCETPEDWIKYLTLLLENPTLISQMGLKARNKIVKEYSLKSTLPKFLSLFDVEIS